MTYFQRQHHVIKRRLTYRGASVTPPPTPTVRATDTSVTGRIYVTQSQIKPSVRRYIYPIWEDLAEEEARKIAEAAPKLPGEIAPGVPAVPEIAEPAIAEAVGVVAEDPQYIADERAASEAADALIAAALEAIASRQAPEPVAVAAVPTISDLVMPDDLMFAPIIAVDDDALVMEAIAIIETLEYQECQ